MGTSDKQPKDWKFYTQLGVLVSGIAGGLQANSSLADRVLRLEVQQQNQIEAFKDFKEEIRELKSELKKLREDMAAKKIVNIVAED